MAVRANVRMTQAKRDELYQRYLKGDTLRNLARCFGTSIQRVEQIVIEMSQAKKRPSLTDKLKEAYPEVYAGTVVSAVNSLMRSNHYKGDTLVRYYMSYKDFFAILDKLTDSELKWVRNLGVAKIEFLRTALNDYKTGRLREPEAV